RSKRDWSSDVCSSDLEVKFVRSLDEDLKRRDFTVNALALTKDGEVIDLFGGVQDMSAQILRAVGKPEERFHEDALRMMRAVRFRSEERRVGKGCSSGC